MFHRKYLVNTEPEQPEHTQACDQPGPAWKSEQDITLAVSGQLVSAEHIDQGPAERPFGLKIRI